ncbi:hypothetical protein AXF42_Ash013451 [Apostasia shenzhenica]|uniref:Uncharacterized protein n=1 Tax=Apostasia shenzhenica TaxID=1088818 RepID=A0A2I0A492_9ASPA|nr:hypothetical protein AXF42_Ash013451 [Apostasia shenzhenica]
MARATQSVVCFALRRGNESCRQRGGESERQKGGLLRRTEEARCRQIQRGPEGEHRPLNDLDLLRMASGRPFRLPKSHRNFFAGLRAPPTSCSLLQLWSSPKDSANLKGPRKTERRPQRTLQAPPKYVGKPNPRYESRTTFNVNEYEPFKLRIDGNLPISAHIHIMARARYNLLSAALMRTGPAWGPIRSRTDSYWRRRRRRRRRYCAVVEPIL